MSSLPRGLLLAVPDFPDRRERKTVSLASARAARVDPDQIVIVVLRDVKENASTENTSEEIEALIQERREARWEPKFLGVGIDAWDASRESGYASKSASTTSAGRKEVSEALYSAAEGVSDYAAGKEKSVEIEGEGDDAEE